MMRMTEAKKRRTTAIDRSFSKAFSSYRPPEDLTVSEWAEKYRVLSRESSAEAGPWRNERTPYLVEPMEAVTDPAITDVTLVAASQVGKSEFELNAIGYIIDQDPGSILYIQPTLDDAKKFSKLRVSPMIRDSMRLRSKVADVKSRDSSNTILQKSFPGGMMTMIGSQTASALSSTPSRYVLGDEVDRWALSAGTEGDPWELAKARTATFYNAKRIRVSTPTIKGASKIEEAFNDGTRERWCHRCPHCGDWSNIVWDNIKAEHEVVVSGKRKDYIVGNVEWCCPSCGCLSAEHTMRSQPAKWIADNPEALKRGHRSFWLNAFASPWKGWADIAYAFFTASSDPQKLKVVFNTLLGELWEERGDLEDEDAYLARREDYGALEDGSPVELPDGVLVLTCGVDTQDDRLEYEVVGHGHFGETWGIKKGVIAGDPNDDEPWKRLDDVIERVYTFANGRGLSISMTFVDSGGHKVQSVYSHCRARINRRVFAIKGVGGDSVPYTRPPSKVKIVVNGKAIGTAWLYAIGVDSGKTDIMSNLKVQEAGAKFCHFPTGEARGYDLAYFNGLLSEKLIQKAERGRTRWAWVKLPGHERNEPLDCRNYALAALRVLDPDMDAIERRLRGMGDKAKESTAAQPQRRRGAVKRREREDEW